MYPSCLYGESYEEDSTGCNIVDEKNKLICVLQQENTNLKQALNKIRKCCKTDCIEVHTREYGSSMVCDIYDILQIINEAIGDDDSGNK